MGNTPDSQSRLHLLAVHPHLRGEHAFCCALHSVHDGSPPPAWGTPRRDVVAGGRVRFTPTCVGNTSTRLKRTACLCGSPPPAWGTQTCVCHSLCGFRFTPTCVGNTGESASGERPSSVHTHLRGEHPMSYVTDVSSFGSPPPAWGTQQPAHWHLSVLRFTPTCVGNTFPPFWPVASHCGSPPPAWGTLMYSSALDVSLRFTPTCVGNTMPACWCSGTGSVHPHLRGEHV